jgi:hypothetical protein
MALPSPLPPADEVARARRTRVLAWAHVVLVLAILGGFVLRMSLGE